MTPTDRILGAIDARISKLDQRDDLAERKIEAKRRAMVRDHQARTAEAQRRMQERSKG